MKAPMTKRPKPRPATTSSWDIYLARHSPAKWIGTVEAVDADAAIEQAVKQLMQRALTVLQQEVRTIRNEIAHIRADIGMLAARIEAIEKGGGRR